MRTRILMTAVSTLALAFAAGAAHAGATFDAVKKKGFVQKPHANFSRCRSRLPSQLFPRFVQLTKMNQVKMNSNLR